MADALTPRILIGRKDRRPATDPNPDSAYIRVGEMAQMMCIQTQAVRRHALYDKSFPKAIRRKSAASDRRGKTAVLFRRAEFQQWLKAWTGRPVDPPQPVPTVDGCISLSEAAERLLVSEHRVRWLARHEPTFPPRQYHGTRLYLDKAALEAWIVDYIARFEQRRRERHERLSAERPAKYAARNRRKVERRRARKLAERAATIPPEGNDE